MQTDGRPIRRGEATGFGPEARARVQARTAMLATSFKGCTKRELEMLIRYYVSGEDEQAVLARFGATQAEFQQLRAKLRKSAVPAGPQPPRVKVAAV